MTVIKMMHIIITSFYIKLHANKVIYKMLSLSPRDSIDTPKFKILENSLLTTNIFR